MLKGSGSADGAEVVVVGFNEVEDTGATVVLVVNVGIKEVDVQGGLVVVGTWQTSFFGKAPTNDTISTNNGRNLCILQIL